MCQTLRTATDKNAQVFDGDTLFHGETKITYGRINPGSPSAFFYRT
jgi:hypothetical protein